MVITYKQKCGLCRKNYTLVRRNEFPVCYDCQKKDMEGQISDPAMKEMFDIPEEFYRQSSFLRSIKINYLRYKALTEKQISAFKNVTDKMKKDKN